MALVDCVVQELHEEVPLPPNTALVTDSDNTLFERGTDRLYPDADRQLRDDLATPFFVTLVSANPDSGLAEDRLAVVRELTGENTETAEVHPPRPVLSKYSLYREAARLLTRPELVVV